MNTKSKTKSQAEPVKTTNSAKPESIVVSSSRTTKTQAVERVAPIVPSTKSVKGDKPKKHKMVRDSFTMPHDDYAQISSVKERCLKSGVSVKKSEVLRAALAALCKLSDANLIKAFSQLETIKTGRPAKP